jgi:hypothetical protein
MPHIEHRLGYAWGKWVFFIHTGLGNFMFRYIFIALLAAVIAAPNTGFAAPSSPRVLLEAGDFDGARTALTQLTKGDPKAGLHRLFLEGLILIHQSNPRAAANVFRKILAVAPDYEPARRELSATLFVLGDNDAAMFHAEQVVALTSDDRIRATAQAIVNASQVGKPSGVTLRFAVQPSSNINQGTKADEIVIGGLPFKVDPAFKAASGVAAIVGATAWRRWQLAERWTGTVSLGVDAKLYASGGPTELTFGPRFDFIYTKARTRFSIGPGVEFKRQAGATTRKRFGVNASYQTRLSDTNGFNFSVLAMKQSFPGQSHRDGWIVDGRWGLSHIVSPSLRLTLGIPFEVQNTGRAHLNHRMLGLTLGADKLWQGGLYTGIAAIFENDQFSGVYPGLTYARHDRAQTLSLSFRHSKINVGAFTPEVTVSVTKHRSNVAFFDYQSRDLSVGFSSKF